MADGVEDASHESWLGKFSRVISQDIAAGPARKPEEPTASVTPPPASEQPTSTAEQMAANQVSTGIPASGPPASIAAPKPDPAATTNVTSRPQLALAGQQTTTQGGVKLPDELKKAQLGAFDTAEKLNQQRAEKEMLSNQAQNNAWAAHNEMERKKIEHDQIQRDRQQEQAQEAYKQWQGAVDEHQKANVNPNRLMDNMGTGGKMLAALSVGLGAFGSAITKTPNYAQQIIRDAVEDDIKAQTHAIDKLGNNVTNKANAIAHFRQQGMDMVSAQNAARVLRYDQLQQKLAQLTLGSKNEMVQQQAAERANELRSLKLAAQAEQITHEQGKQTTVSAYTPAAASGVVPTEDLAKLHVISEANTELKNFRKAREASRRFTAFVDAKADGPAIMDFIASGLNQGSFTPTFIDMLNKRSTGGSLMEKIRASAKGGYDPELIKTLQRSLNTAQAAAWQGAEPAARELKRRGLEYSLSVGGETTSESATKLGGRLAE